MKVNEIVEVIEELNAEMEYIEDISEKVYFSVETTGFCSAVKFCGGVLWSSEDDTRKFIDEIDDYESLREYLIREQNKLIDNIIKLRIKV